MFYTSFVIIFLERVLLVRNLGNNYMYLLVGVSVSLVGKHTIDLGNNCGQLSQTKHRGHHSMIVSDLYTKG